MNLDEHRALETAIDRELKRLPELRAPDTLAPAVMAQIERRSTRRWYRQPWPAWPRLGRIASLAALLAIFSGLCFGGWHWSQSDSAGAASRGIADGLSRLAVAWETIQVLLTSALLVARSLGPLFIAASVVAAMLSYAACVGLGTVVVRIAAPRRQEIQL